MEQIHMYAKRLLYLTFVLSVLASDYNLSPHAWGYECDQTTSARKKGLGSDLLMVREIDGRRVFDDGPLDNVPPAEVVELKLANPTDHPDILEKLVTLTNLRKLTLYSGATDKEVAYVGSIRNLQELYLYDAKLSRKGLLSLPEMKSVESLYLNNGTARDEVLEGLVRFPNLRTLNLEDKSSTVTDDGIRHLHLPKLRNLYLNWTHVGDRGVEELHKFPELEYLSLYATKCTDKCIDSLATLPKLKKVAVYRTRISEVGIRRLRLLQPSLRIDNSD